MTVEIIISLSFVFVSRNLAGWLNPTCETVLGTCGPVLGNFKENTLIVYVRKVAAADFYIFVLSFVDTLHMDNLFVMTNEHSSAVGDLPSKLVKKSWLLQGITFFTLSKSAWAKICNYFQHFSFLFWMDMHEFVYTAVPRQTNLFALPRILSNLEFSS